MANEIGRDEIKIGQLMPPPPHPPFATKWYITEQVSQLVGMNFVDYGPPELLRKLIVTFSSESMSFGGIRFSTTNKVYKAGGWPIHLSDK